MDSSKQTITNIQDEQSPSFVTQRVGNICRTSFVPRKLSLGDDEYIRIGSNKLVRYPKKLVHFSRGNIRHGLRTSILHLSKLQQQCQFFTRFGKCNNGANCPYIHDPAKIVVCAKFIRGSCSDTNCRLTHKVIPERMPDCLYFLQALCTNVNCPYRHVHVSPKAPICESFLKGYCADGDECCKKHSYICPQYESMGKCSQGSKCKLYHPMHKVNLKKNEQPIVQTNNRNRYFGGNILKAGEPILATSEKHEVNIARNISYSGGHSLDYIPLDASSGDNVEVDALTDSRLTPCVSEPPKLQQHDLDALIKPVLIMKDPNLTNSYAGGSNSGRFYSSNEVMGMTKLSCPNPPCGV